MTWKQKICRGEQTQILLYFLDSDEKELMPEYRYVSLERIKDNMYQTIIEELIKGPSTSEYKATVPKDTKINSINKDGNKVIVDLSKEYSQGVENSEEDLGKIYSIVNTLTEIKEIEEVEIKVDGKEITSKTRL